MTLTCRDLILVDNKGQKFEEGKQYVLKLGKVQGSRGQVNMKPGPQTIPEFTNDTLPARAKDGIPFMLVKEDNSWKVDLLSSTLAILGGG